MRRSLLVLTSLLAASLGVAACVDDSTPSSGGADSGASSGDDAGPGGGGTDAGGGGGGSDAGGGGGGGDSGGGGDDAGAGGKRVFLSSTTSGGTLGGLQGADDTCANLADAAGMGRNFKAWISDDSTATSPVGRFTQSTGPYVRVDGARVADNFTALTAPGGSLQHPINVTEKKATVTGQFAWTNTNANGDYAASSPNCLHWSGPDGTGGPFVGDPDMVGPGWTNSTFHDCANTAGHLYCFEQ